MPENELQGMIQREGAQEALRQHCAPAEPPSVTVEKRVAQYVQVRDAIAAQKKLDEEKLKPLVDLQNLLTGWLQDFMDKAGADSVKTSSGTCYSSSRYTASLADPEIFMSYVIKAQDFDLLDRKANVTAVKAYVAEHNQLPPGVNLNAIKTVGVRRAPGK